MKITSVEPIHLRVPVVEALPDGTLDVLVVKIHTDEGITRVGEVTSQSYVCKACFDAPRSAAHRRTGTRPLHRLPGRFGAAGRRVLDP